jgi:RNA polymerase sigma factor for flagellar operon FliA
MKPARSSSSSASRGEHAAPRLAVAAAAKPGGSNGTAKAAGTGDQPSKGPRRRTLEGGGREGRGRDANGRDANGKRTDPVAAAAALRSAAGRAPLHRLGPPPAAGAPRTRRADPLRERAVLWARHGAEASDLSRNALVEAYQELVAEVVRRFAGRLPRSVDRGDLLTAANVGLMAAVSSFDPARGVPFEAYGERRIKGALLDELRNQDWLPRPWRQRIELHKRVLERLRGQFGRTPRDEEVAECLDLSLDDYQLLFGQGLPGAPAGPAPLDEGDEDGSGVLDVVPDPRGAAPDLRLTQEELLGLVAQRLTDQEYRIVYLKYWEELPMREIGELTGLSESRVCKIHARLIERLQARLGRLQLEA